MNTIPQDDLILRFTGYRCVYVNVAAPQPGFQGGPAKYRLVVMVPKTAPDRATCTTYQAIKARCDAIATVIKGAPTAVDCLEGQLGIINDGDLKEQDWGKGHWLVSLSKPEKFGKPALYDVNGQPLADGGMLPEGVPIGSGDWFNVVANGFKGQGDRVFFGLAAVQHVRSDERIGGSGGIDTSDPNALFAGGQGFGGATTPQQQIAPGVAPGVQQPQPAGYAPAAVPQQQAGVVPPGGVPPVAPQIDPATGQPYGVPPVAQIDPATGQPYGGQPVAPAPDQYAAQPMAAPVTPAPVAGAPVPPKF